MNITSTNPMEHDSQKSKIDLFPLQSLSPGERAKLEMAIRILSNPENKFNRQTVQTAYGIQLPSIPQVDEEQLRHMYTEDKNPSTLERYPSQKSKVFHKHPVPMSDGTMPHNVMELIHRGLIPPKAEVYFDPPVIRTRAAPLHEERLPAANTGKQPIKSIMAISEFCTTYTPQNDDEALQVAPRREEQAAKDVKKLTCPKQIKQSPLTVKIVNVGNMEIKRKSESVEDINTSTMSSGQPVFLTQSGKQNTFNLTQPPTTPASVTPSKSIYWLLVQDEIFQRQAIDFQAFERNNRSQWHFISRVIAQLEDCFHTYNIPNAMVHGNKLVELTKRYENTLQSIPKLALVSCMQNAEDFARIIVEPGRQFKGRAGVTKAVIMIQSHIRRIQARKFFSEYKRQRNAVDVFLSAWRRRQQMRKIRASLAEHRKIQTQLSQNRLKELGTKWDDFERNSHVMIHLSSVGYPEKVRRLLRDSGELEYMESRQISRLCALRNANTDVVYVSRASVSDDLLEYYAKLVGLSGAVSTGDANDQKSLGSRFRILVPEAIECFQGSTAPPLCLATLLKYSPRALKHIRHFIAGRPALIVPGLGVHADDFAVAEVLNIPVWTAPPVITKLFTHQSSSRRLVNQICEAHDSDEDETTTQTGQSAGGSRTSMGPPVQHKPSSAGMRDPRRRLTGITRSAGVSSGTPSSSSGKSWHEVKQPPGDYDVFDVEQLYEALAELFTDNLPHSMWLLKIDTAVNGHGTARINLENMRSFGWAKEQRMWYGPARWAKKWAQESTYLRVLAEVPELIKNHLELCSKAMYSDIDSFMLAFLAEGGVIEACPPTKQWTNLFVNMAILPNGQVRMLASGDQLHAGNPVSCWGATIPTTSVDPVWLNSVSYKLADAMLRKRFLGHFKIDFVTFIHPDDDQQVLWVTGVRPGYADTLAMFQLVLFSCDATFEVNHVTGAHTIQSRAPQKIEGGDKKPIVPQERRGILFTPMDSFRREYLGMVSIGDSLDKAVTQFAATLGVLHQEISTPNMPGMNNFKAAVRELKNLHSLIVENSESGPMSNLTDIGSALKKTIETKSKWSGKRRANRSVRISSTSTNRDSLGIS